MAKFYSIVILALCFCMFNCTLMRIPSEDEIKEKWAQHKIDNGLSYDVDEDKIRFETFKSNYLKVMAHNTDDDDGTDEKKIFKTTVNQFSSMTYEEYLQKVLSKKIDIIDLANKTKDLNLDEPSTKMDSTNIPSSFDWRKTGYVVPPKQQYSCGSCWAFATTGAVETLYGYKYGTLRRFSEQELVDCTRTGSYANYGCNGGYPSNGFYHAYSTGLVEESVYPYNNRDNGYCYANSRQKRYKVRGFGSIKFGDEQQLKNVVATYGPVAVALDASDWAFSQYSSGIYYSRKCNPSNLNHAVLVVGYGSEGGYDYWIIKNSWGSSWGTNGYMKMARGYNMCGVASLAAYAYL